MYVCVGDAEFPCFAARFLSQSLDGWEISQEPPLHDGYPPWFPGDHLG